MHLSFRWPRPSSSYSASRDSRGWSPVGSRRKCRGSRPRRPPRTLRRFPDTERHGVSIFFVTRFFKSADIDRSSVDIGRPATNIDRISVDIDSPATKIGRNSVDIDSPATNIDRDSVDLDKPATNIDRRSVDIGSQSAEVCGRPAVAGEEGASRSRRRGGLGGRPGTESQTRCCCSQDVHCPHSSCRQYRSGRRDCQGVCENFPLISYIPVWCNGNPDGGRGGSQAVPPCPLERKTGE
jgi:hypothetical protein